MKKIEFDDVRVGDTVREISKEDSFTIELEFVVEYKTDSVFGNYTLSKELNIEVSKYGRLPSELFLVKERNKKASEFPIATVITVRSSDEKFVNMAIKSNDNNWLIFTDDNFHSVGSDKTIDKYELQEKNVKVTLPDGIEFKPNDK